MAMGSMAVRLRRKFTVFSHCSSAVLIQLHQNISEEKAHRDGHAISSFPRYDDLDAYAGVRGDWPLLPMVWLLVVSHYSLWPPRQTYRKRQNPWRLFP